ncbi:uncharacterized protein [Nicotiana tomentosiformis]|uniref:uncharacterized protein n=1 Tax=Nicotiana tomentosiformis TaxID=4098 RepID=UPI00388C8F6F
MSAKGIKRLDKFTKLFSPRFGGTPSEDPQDFFDCYHEILRNMGIVKSNEVDFTVFQMHGATKRWWQVDASVLFDLGSNYLYVSSYFGHYLDMTGNSLGMYVHVSTSVGDSIVMDYVYRLCVVTIDGYKARVDLLLLGIIDFEVILGMDWLSSYHAILYCHAKTVTLAMPGFPRVERRDSLGHIPSRVVSFLKGCLAYLAFVRDVNADTTVVKSVSIVMQFPDMFLVDLPGMPLDMDIDFGIDLGSGTQPISIPTYRMELIELKELKEQLHELLDIGFIRPSVSPWGTPVLL